MKTKYKVVSLFSGFGGMDLGICGGFTYLGRTYSEHGASIELATDYDYRVAETYNTNFEHEILIRDIRDLDAQDVPEHDILTGGFPCQSFSVAATNPPRLGYKDIRGQLFFEMVRILSLRKPDVFVAENVKGLLSANKGAAFPLVLNEFEAAGYFVKWKVLNAVHFGVPQKRERVFLVGFKSEEVASRFRFPVGQATSPTPLSEVLEAESVDDSFFFSDKAVRGMLETKNSKIMNKGRAQSPDSPCNTVGAHLAKVSLNSTDPVFLDSGRYRMFTPREVARIQSFPESFGLPSSKSVSYRGLGNAVAPVMMWHVMKEIRAALEHRV